VQSRDGGPASEAGVAAVVGEVLGVQVPRVRSVPAYAATRGQEAVDVARSVGLELDAFQELLLMDACGVRDDGKWAAFEVGVNVPRQNGKGGILEARELAGIFEFGERMLLHSAHEFQTATEAMLRMEELLEFDRSIACQVKSVSRSHGSEGFIFKSGQRLRYRTRTKGGGRGFTGDFLALDEAMVLQEMFIGALLPTLSGRSMHGNPQVYYTGSAVDQLVHEHGIVFARVRERGLRGNDPSLVYHEYSAADAADADGVPITPDRLDGSFLSDPERWAAANPGLGIRISPEHIEKELRAMDDRTFAVERLGVGDYPATDGSGASVIDIDKWDMLGDATSRLVDPVGLAFDVSPDRASASIGAAGDRPDGLAHLEVIDDRRGTGWLVDRLVELDERHAPVGVFCDASGPAASLIPELEARGVSVTAVNATEHAQACGMLFDLVEQRRARHLGTAELRTAVKGAAKRPLGDAWAWSRKSSAVNISPLVAVTLANWGHATVPATGEPSFAFA
jgi:hypothetical protein